MTVAQTHVWKTAASGAVYNADNHYSNLVTARPSLPRAQIPDLLPRATYRSRPPQGGQNPKELGLQHRQEKAQDAASLIANRLSPIRPRAIETTPCTFMHYDFVTTYTCRIRMSDEHLCYVLLVAHQHI